MNNAKQQPDAPSLIELDSKRTERPQKPIDQFYWQEDILCYTGKWRLYMSNALSQLPTSTKESFKQNLISFTKQDNYSPNSYISFFGTLGAALNKCPAKTFDFDWIAQALKNSKILKNKSGITNFLRYWQERDSSAISLEALRLLNDAAGPQQRPRNVLSDDPEKSWLTDEEYECLLSTLWKTFESGTISNQVMLIKLLSMQYARRPIQIAHLKICDIRENNNQDSREPKGRIIDFPGAKDTTAKTDFRDSKFEPHPLADHLWNLYHVQRHEIRALYEHTLGFTLTDDQLKKMPLFCSEARIKEARTIIEQRYKLNLLENIDSSLFHLHRYQIGKILTWKENTPNCNYDLVLPKRTKRPKPPISPRTGRVMVVSAIRMRHTRARQLARMGVSKHMLSHWLGHTSGMSLAAYYSDPAEQARELDRVMVQVLSPLAMAFTGKLIDVESQATRAGDPTSILELATAGQLKSVGCCGKHSFCATTSIPIPCYRCRHFEPLVDAPHQEVLSALVQRQAAEEQVLKIGGTRNLLIPIDLSADIRAVKNCIERCNTRKAEQEMKP